MRATNRDHGPLPRSPRGYLPRAFALALLAAALGGCSSDDDDDGTLPPGDGGGAGDVDQLNDLTGSTMDVTVELHEGTNMAAAPSPDGERIVFSAQGALWTIPVTGGDATRITPWTMEPTAPVWAPDGESIAFQNYTEEGNFHIWTIEPDGSDATELTSGFFDDREPAWSPDGGAVVFSSDRSGDQQYKIWSYTLASGELQQLSIGLGAESDPAVSPDGEEITFVDTAVLYTVPAAGGERSEVGPGLAPSYLPDGSGLVHQTPERALVVGGTTVSEPDEDLFPFPVRWLPDGRFLYTASGKIRTREGDGSDLRDIPFSAEITVRRPVIDAPKDRGFDDLGPRPVLGVSYPVISPDGQRIAFVALNDVWTMTIGEAPERLTDDTDRDSHPQWTPDGSAVYFSTEKDNAGSLAIDRIDVPGGERTRLGAIPAKSMVRPMMSPSGDRIAYTTGAGQLEIWDIAAQSAEEIIEQVSRQVSTAYWLPDESRIMLVDNEAINNRFREGYNKLRVIDIAAKTGTFHPVADIPRQVSDREEGAAALSPDGSQVAFIMDSVLHVMPVNPDGSPAGEATAITEEVADMPSWAGDSSTILYKSGPVMKTIQADGSGAAEIPFELTWQQVTGPGTTIVHAGSLWDGVSDALQTDVDIVIDGNRIADIRAHQDSAEAEADRFVDASALTVMPGLFDPHLHPLDLYQGAQFGQVAAMMLAYGITSSQSVAGPLHQSIEIREAIDAGNLLGPRVFASPPLWEGNRQFYSFARTLRTPEVADLEIAKAIAMDTDYMKSYVRAPIPIMNRIAQGGLDLGVPTGTHMLSPGAATGLGGTTHLSATQRMGYGWAKSVGGVAYQDAYDLHAQSDFHVVDTLFSSLALVGQDPAFLGDERFELLTPPNFVTGLLETPEPDEETVARVRKDAEQSAKVAEAGGLLAIGTDTPLVTPGIALHTNLRGSALAVSNLEALRNVTINAARMSYLDADLGSVEIGKLADLSIVAGNPLADLRAAADVKLVVKNGMTISLDEILAPFRTPEAVAKRRAALRAHWALCHSNEGAAGDPSCRKIEHVH